ncbi:MAG TPA: GNAT family protein [Candidatus Limnocylindrales bacterium]|nr:GNAT family protein [Candidatus Limnocylindrales bacterium]
MKLLPYTDADYWLTEALETDPGVMAELGGPWQPEDIPGIHRRRLDSIARGSWWFTIVPEPDIRPVGHLGIFHSEWQGEHISEAGWSMLPAHQGKGYASAALKLLLERAAADGRWGAIHAFPGVTNAPSNALCRRFGFALVGEGTVDYGGRPLRCNHWILEEAS